jgi:hypothetical protein
MTGTLKQAGMVLTLVLISLGVFVLYDAFPRQQPAHPKSFVVGATLCSLALALLYSLGRSDEK